jgi:hypothetical protein
VGRATTIQLADDPADNVATLSKTSVSAMFEHDDHPLTDSHPNDPTFLASPMSHAGHC